MLLKQTASDRQSHGGAEGKHWANHDTHLPIFVPNLDLKKSVSGPDSVLLLCEVIL